LYHLNIVGQAQNDTGVITWLPPNIEKIPFVDVWIDPLYSRYSFHWEQRAKRGLIYRHDNAPDHPHIATFPKHFHDGDERQVEESHISDNPKDALREFLEFVRVKLEEFGC
jgi:hypothetical protein